MATEAEMRSHRCCFTGHRPEKIGIPEEMVIDLLDKAISEAIRADIAPLFLEWHEA